MSVASVSCDLCEEFAGRDLEFTRAFGVAGANRILARSRDFVLMVDLSPLRVGHLLLCAREHFLNMIDAARSARAEFEDFTSDVLATYPRLFGPATVLEHGAVPSDVPSFPNCIEHAHWHVMPDVVGDIGSLAQHDLGSPGIAVSRDDLLEVTPSGDYFLCGTGEQFTLFTNVVLPWRQYARSIVARSTGVVDAHEWDWGTHPQPDLVESTIAKWRDNA